MSLSGSCPLANLSDDFLDRFDDNCRPIGRALANLDLNQSLLCDLDARFNPANDLIGFFVTYGWSAVRDGTDRGGEHRSGVAVRMLLQIKGRSRWSRF
jgi:hypothetical protein